MAFLAAALPYIALAGSAVSAYGQKQAGEVANIDAQSVALQQERQGIASQAESQRQAIDQTRQAKYLQSRATALAAASGAKASDPTIQNILANIGTEGEFRALSALYSGDTDRQLAEAAAAATRNRGRAAQRSANLNAGSTILQGASSFYGKYGGFGKTNVAGMSGSSNINFGYRPSSGPIEFDSGGG